MSIIKSIKIILASVLLISIFSFTSSPKAEASFSTFASYITDCNRIPREYRHPCLRQAAIDTLKNDCTKAGSPEASFACIESARRAAVNGCARETDPTACVTYIMAAGGITTGGGGGGTPGGTPGGTTHGNSDPTTGAGDSGSGGADSGVDTSDNWNPTNIAKINADCSVEGDLDTDNCKFLAFLVGAVKALSAVVGVVVVITIVVGGIQYSTARNNPQAVASAKKKIFMAVLALVIYLFGFAFLNWLVPGGII